MHLDTPTITLESQEYWAAANDGRLLLKCCSDCGRHFHYPRAYCPYCMSDRTDWIEASGRGTIYTYTVMRRGPDAGTIPAFITLNEGPKIMAGIVDASPDAVNIGASVRLYFVRTEGDQNIPLFTLDQQEI
jgi:uncharacterized protein